MSFFGPPLIAVELSRTQKMLIQQNNKLNNFLIFYGYELSILFVANLLWEFLQMPLYFGHTYSLPYLLMGVNAAGGDVLLSLIVLALASLFLKNENELSVAGYTFLALGGLCVGIIFEQYSLMAGHWSYAATMPLIPILHTGVTPTLQLGLLIPFSFWLTHHITKNK